MTSTGWAAAAVALIIIVAGGWFLISNSSPTDTTQTTGTATTTGTLTGTVLPSDNATSSDNGITEAHKTVTVSYTDSGFVPKSVTVSKGDTVMFVNTTGRSMWIGSDQHPTHTEYDGTNRTGHCAAGYTGAKPFDQCGTGSSFSFTFDKTGSFNYHNHSAAQFGGSVVVQ